MLDVGKEFMRLDPATILVELLIVELFLALLMALYASHRKVYPGFSLWTGSVFAVALGFLGFLVRPPLVPAVPVYFLTTSSFMFAALLRVDGILRFLGRRGLSGRWYVVVLLLAAGCACLGEQAWRGLVASTFIAAWIVYSIPILLGVREAGRHLYVTAAALSAARAVSAMGRALVIWNNPTMSLLEGTVGQTLFFTLHAVGEVGIVAVFMLLNSLSLELELAASTTRLADALDEFTKSMANLKVLRGFLCICMHCKRIRVRGEHWEEIEDYVHQHSEAEFNASRCPECLLRDRDAHGAEGRLLPAGSEGDAPS